MDRTTQYPHHLARLVGARLRAEGSPAPPETVLTRLLETLYFAGLETGPGRRIVCTVDLLDPGEEDAKAPARRPAGRWTVARFDPPLPFDVRTLTALARAADPAHASLAVWTDRRNRLFIWAMVDQEPGADEDVGPDSAPVRREGLLRATLDGPGNIAVYCGPSLVGRLVQNALIQEHHDVLWTGPIHALLRQHLEASLAQRVPTQGQLGDPWRDELLVRWLSSISRILAEVRHAHQEAGLVILAHDSLDDVEVDYVLGYDRLLGALVRLVQSLALLRQLNPGREARGPNKELAERSREVLGAVRFIASLCGAHGVVLLDRGLAVRGFGARLRASHPVADAYLAGDALATATDLRRVDLARFGNRQQAMIRYCHAHPGTLGLAVSSDGDVQAMTRIGPRLVLWENVAVPCPWECPRP